MYFGLNEPEVIEKKNEIEKVFDYKEDLEEKNGVYISNGTPRQSKPKSNPQKFGLGLFL